MTRTSQASPRWAAERLLRCYERLATNNENLLDHIVGGQAFECWKHYPADDIIDRTSGFRYFYHAHALEDRSDAAENGHFHTFACLDPVRFPNRPRTASLQEGDSDTPPTVHLVSIALTAQGIPFKLFTANRWVTGDHWCTAAEATALAREFRINRVGPQLVADWINSIFSLYKVHISALLTARDTQVARLASEHKSISEALDDRTAEVLSVVDIDVGKDIDAALRDAPLASKQILVCSGRENAD